MVEPVTENAWIDLLRSGAVYEEREYVMRPVMLHPAMTDMIALAKEIGMPHELSRPILTAAQVMEFKANTARYVLRPTYVGGKEWYGDPMTLARERILFVTALIRIMRP